MPTSATGRQSRGLTLIELVVVVAIMGLLAMPVMLRFGGGGLFGGGTTGQAVQTRLTAELGQMRDRALFTRQVWRLVPDAAGWDWSVRARGPASGQVPTPDWTPEGESVRFDGLALIWQIEAPAGDDPAVFLMPDRRGTPFSVRLGAGGGICRFDGWGDLACTDR